MPEQRPLEVVTEQPASAEEGDHALAVGHRCRGGKAILFADVGLRRLGGSLAAPEQVAIGPAETVQEALAAVGCRAGEEDVVVPDNRRGVALARDLAAPEDASAVFVPMERQIFQAS